MNCRIALASLSLVALPALAAAQAPAEAAPSAPAAGRRIQVPEGTEFVAVFTQALSSKTSASGDAVKLTVDEPVIVNGDTVIRSGALVRGTITEAKGAGYMGRGGKLNMSIESVTLADGQHAKVRSSKAKGGDDKRGSTIALTVLFGPIGLLRHGNDAEIKAGTPLHLFTDESASIATSR